MKKERKKEYFNMNIPKEFKLLGHTINVVINNDRMQDKNALGHCSPDYITITLATKTDGKDLSESVIGHTYYHELVHMILHTMGESELYKNEKFVDMFGGLLHQAITTSQY